MGRFWGDLYQCRFSDKNAETVHEFAYLVQLLIEGFTDALIGVLVEVRGHCFRGSTLFGVLLVLCLRDLLDCGQGVVRRIH